MKRVILIAALLGFQLSPVLAQGGQVVDVRITSVYGSYAQDLSPEQVSWEQSKLQRSEVRKVVYSSSEQYPKLSSLGVVTKYIPTLKMDTVFDPANINPLKYTINFNDTKEDLVYRIDNTDYVLVIAKKN